MERIRIRSMLNSLRHTHATLTERKPNSRHLESIATRDTHCNEEEGHTVDELRIVKSATIDLSLSAEGARQWETLETTARDKTDKKFGARDEQIKKRNNSKIKNKSFMITNSSKNRVFLENLDQLGIKKKQILDRSHKMGQNYKRSEQSFGMVWDQYQTSQKCETPAKKTSRNRRKRSFSNCQAYLGKIYPDPAETKQNSTNLVRKQRSCDQTGKNNYNVFKLGKLTSKNSKRKGSEICPWDFQSSNILNLHMNF